MTPKSRLKKYIYILLIIEVINIYCRKFKRHETYKEKNYAFHHPERIPFFATYSATSQDEEVLPLL